MSVRDMSTEVRRDLVDRAAAHDIRYLVGGSEWEHRVSPYVGPEGAPLPSLLVDLARAPEARLRTALIALLLRHPEYAPTTVTTARHLADDDRARRLLLVSIVVAAALQREWSFALSVYLGDQRRIEAGHLAGELDLPPPGRDFGQPCLAAAARLLRMWDESGDGQAGSFPFNYEADWEDAARRLLAQLARREHGGT